MAVRRILSMFEPADLPMLRERTREVKDFGPETQVVIDDLLDTLANCADSGVAIAAPQIGSDLRITVVGLDAFEEPLVLVNPRISQAEGELTDFDGCLSIPGVSGESRRAARMHVDAQDRKGDPFSIDLDEYDARIVQHEVDHLDGILFIDRLDDLDGLYRVVRDSDTGEYVKAPLADETMAEIKRHVRKLPPYAVRWAGP